MLAPRKHYYPSMYVCYQSTKTNVHSCMVSPHQNTVSPYTYIRMLAKTTVLSIHILMLAPTKLLTIHVRMLPVHQNYGPPMYAWYDLSKTTVRPYAYTTAPPELLSIYEDLYVQFAHFTLMILRIAVRHLFISIKWEIWTINHYLGLGHNDMRCVSSYVLTVATTLQKYYPSMCTLHIQYIPRNMHTVFALLCFVVVIHWLIFPYPSGLLHWHCGNLAIAPVPARQPWWIWINTSCEFIMNDYITTTKQSTTKPCAYFLGYTVCILSPHPTPTPTPNPRKMRI